MGPSDVVTAIVILVAAGYVLYRSAWKKRGHCHGCESRGACGRR